MTIFENDRALLSGFRKGEREALTRVFQRYVDEVNTVLARGFLPATAGKSRIPGIAEPELERDLVQDVFIRAFSEKARLAYDGLRPYRPYLLQIARNRLADHWRGQGRELPLEREDGSLTAEAELMIETLEPAPKTPEAALEQSRLQAATREYLGGLSAELREFVRLRFEEERSQYEVMEGLGLTRWRVRSMERKVQAGLRRHLKRTGLLDG